ncbi:MAG: UDP-N-acetylglucosamine diphosphorylase/glucosamine-1-phosphate N-acetyltransferase [SAR202 cluster bacterium]|nr:UDP-N-acetylglucosamine diphosphorylase/glucosamine-1-phosphate N-acetyltransferase [SAR202 cluster bacterium]|tara:strand:- start:67 stop:1422 length:1356 start_codon:yes stop_codon:yes gene_type:complete
MDQWAAVIMAAGRGSRMQSNVPKVLHTVCGKEMILYSIERLSDAGITSLIVVVSESNYEPIKNVVGDGVEYVIQSDAKGTGGAVQTVLSVMESGVEHVLVHGADMPLVSEQSLRSLILSHTNDDHQITLLTSEIINSTDLGRILRNDQGDILSIREASEIVDANDISSEVNLGTYCFTRGILEDSLGRLNVKENGELYLTELIEIGCAQNVRIGSVYASNTNESLGVNNRVQLSQVESVQRKILLERLMIRGVTIRDPETVYVDADVNVGKDSTILPNTMILGDTKIGTGCVVGPGSTIKDSVIGNDCRVNNSCIERSVVNENVEIGPYSHIREGCTIGSNAHIGNFVEMKETVFGEFSAAGHFSYLGDADISGSVNIGAGTVTCNFDGENKLKTVIGKGAFIGCDTMLIAPVEIGAQAATGAGSVVTRDIPTARLAFGVPARIVAEDKNN